MFFGIAILVFVVVAIVGSVWAMFRKGSSSVASTPVIKAQPTTTTASAGSASPAVSAAPKLEKMPASGKYADAAKLYNKRAYSEAAAAYRQALDQNPTAVDAPSARYHLSECLNAIGKREESKRVVEALRADLATMTPTADSLRILGKLDRSEGNYMDAYASMESAIKIATPQQGIYYHLAFDLSSNSNNLGRPDLTQYWSTLALSSNIRTDLHEHLLDMAGLSSLSLVETDKAMSFYIEALEIVRKKENTNQIARHLAHLAHVYQERGEYDKAIELARQAVELLPNDPECMCQGVLATVLSIGGRYPEALQVLQTA